MRKTGKKILQTVPTYAVVVDGETEIWYLQMLKRNERNIRINIKPEIPNNKSVEEQYNLILDLSKKEYLKVFWIVDLDTVIKESRETTKGKKTPINIFKEYRSKIHRELENVIVIVNNPCLEYWLLLHFEKTAKIFETCSKAESKLKTHLKDYQKTQKYYTRQNNDIYLKLRPNLKTAIQNASSLGLFNNDDPQKAMCEMELFFHSDELKNYFR